MTPSARVIDITLTALPRATTHSTHITANADLKSYVVLTQTGVPAIASAVPAERTWMNSKSSIWNATSTRPDQTYSLRAR